MRLGIRLQLLLALGALLVLSFAPLFFAVASIAQATLTQARASSARSLGRAIAGHVSVAGATYSASDMRALLDALVGGGGVAAIGVYDGDGKRVIDASEQGAAGALPSEVRPGVEMAEPARTTFGQGVLVVIPNEARAARSSVAVVVRADPAASPTGPLVRLVALYTAAFGAALLVFAYLAMTRLVVGPVDQLSAAAERVASGARTLDVPRRGARELVDLGRSLATMTERLRADEEALRIKVGEAERYAKDLARAQERLVRSERLASVGRLSAGLAHEIGNPLSAIVGLLDLLIDGGLDDHDQRDFLIRAKRETERIHKVLRDLLEFARPSRGESIGAPEPAGSVADAIDDVAALLAPQKELQDITLDREIEAGVGLVPLPRGKLVQVLLNLLLNAASASPKGGRIIVRVSKRGDDNVRIEVEDNGPGIAPEVRDKLFEPFVTTKPVGEGTGLGLAVCRGLVEAAGGSITFEDNTPSGARFVVELPNKQT